MSEVGCGRVRDVVISHHHHQRGNVRIVEGRRFKVLCMDWMMQLDVLWIKSCDKESLDPKRTVRE